MVHEAAEARRPRAGWCTVHGPAVPLAFLEITSVTVDEVQHLVRSCEAVLPAQMAYGCTLHHVWMPLTRCHRWLNQDKLN